MKLRDYEDWLLFSRQFLITSGNVILSLKSWSTQRYNRLFHRCWDWNV